MVDSNRSFCLRLAEITHPLLGRAMAATAASAPRPQARVSVPEPAPPHTAPPTLMQELSELFGDKAQPPASCLADPVRLAAALESRPDVQSRLAVITQYTPSKWLLERELEASGYWHPTPDPVTGERPDAYEVARQRSATGLSLSGGGIRSATFNLGILQGLARHSRISRFDYLSSVSGGGYIHQFLANWVYKAGSCSTVESLLDPIPNASGDPDRATVQPEPLRWLRRYSNYLAPRKGAFSLDSWTIVAVWVRNTALNLIVLLAGLFFLLLLPHFGTMLYAPLRRHVLLGYILSAVLFVVYIVIAINLYRWLVDIHLPGPPPGRVKLTAIALFLASSFITPAIYRSSLPGGNSTNPQASEVFKPVTNSEELHYQTTYTHTASGSNRNDEQLHVSVDSREPQPQSRLRTHWEERPRPLILYALYDYALYDRRSHIFLLVFLCLSAGFLTAVTWASRIPRVLIPVFSLFGLVVSYVLVEGIRLLFFVAAFAVPPGLIPALGVVIIPLLTFGVPFLTVETGLGLIGRSSDSAQREWLARARAFSFLFGGAWLLLSAFSLLGPTLFDHIAGYTRTSYTLWIGWLATSIGGALTAKSSHTSRGSATSSESTDSPSLTSRLSELLARIAPPIFIAGLLVLISKFTAWTLVVSDPTDGGSQHLRFAILALTSLAVAALFGWRVDINDFSMHTFYRDRLARCYAGASTTNRIPNRFTGFTRDDRDLRMHQLLPAGYTIFNEHFDRALDNAGQPLPVGDYHGPFPIICTSINLTLGEDLAYQERKAASFAFTPLFSGFNVGWTSAKDSRNQFNGFVPTRDYVYTREGGLMLATAVAISGAAASPSMGYHSNPAIAFLLTVFNVRLGWWLRNPRRRQSAVAASPAQDPPAKPPTAPRPLPSSPRFGVLKLATELLGHSDDVTSYVYLTDGGHFDNMGLYELLRRRCRDIIVCDGEADSHLHFEGIGMAIRKARLDFGIEVTLEHIDPVRTDPDRTAPTPLAPVAHTAMPKAGAPSIAPSAMGGTSRESATAPAQSQPNPHPESHPHPESQTQPQTENQSAAPTPPTPQDEPQHPAELPYVLSAHISSTDPSGVTGSLTPRSAPTVEGLSSFAEFPGNSIHCVHGTIRYPEDSSPDQFGRILYIKASLTGDEPPDLLNYRRQHENFPHDTTLNQFFTESQFESYRRLGEHIILTDKTAISWMQRHLDPQPNRPNAVTPPMPVTRP